MSKHTPGPWSFVEHNWSETSIYGSCDTGEQYLGTLSIKDQAAEDTQEALEQVMRANALLIAAAPDMLEALEDLLPEIRCQCGEAYLSRGMHHPNSLCHHVAAIEAAIAKATGKD